ncbi:4Fe-4S dicluster domain-containing protein [Hydrogenimonas sp.]
MARYGMAFDYTLCIDCGACETACKEENGIPLGAGQRRLWIETTEPEGDYYALVRDAATFMPRQCMQCEDAPCITACTQGAIWRDENGIVRTDPTLCTLLGHCFEACPYDARFIHTGKHYADHCIFCADTRLARGETTTACQITCPAKLRIFGDLDDPESEISRVLREREYFVLQPENGTRPKIFYLKRKEKRDL